MNVSLFGFLVGNICLHITKLSNDLGNMDCVLI